MTAMYFVQIEKCANFRKKFTVYQEVMYVAYLCVWLKTLRVTSFQQNKFCYICDITSCLHLLSITFINRTTKDDTVSKSDHNWS